MVKLRHVIADLHGCPRGALDDVEIVRMALIRGAEAAKCRIVNNCFHQFRPQGVTGVVVVEESHLSIHTWPEHGFAAVDVCTCGEADPIAGLNAIRAALTPEHMNVVRDFERIVVEEHAAQNPLHHGTEPTP
ncbi:MAG: adenosylmethionine decarboxylase [Patescibacteria group bacterium]